MPDPSRLSLVFDLDGTLVDSAPDLAAAMNAVLVRHGRRPVPAARVRSLVGRGAKVLMARGFAETGAPAEDGLLDRLYDEFLEHYLAHIADETRPFPGVEAVLGRLGARGIGLAVCTNKPEGAAVRLLDALGLSTHFGAVIGGDTLPVKKPDPATFRESLRRLGRDGNPAAMVGDSETDVLTARAAGAPVIGVSFGYTDRPVATFGPDALIHHFDELEAAVARVLDSAARRGELA